MARRQLPIFPLPVVLFPGAPQLLHIFEPRYRQMLSDCMNADRTFGLSFVSTDLSDDPKPRGGDVGCCAAIQGTRQLPDGRSNILTTGGDRYVLDEYLDGDTPYLVAMVDTFDDVDEDESGLEDLARRVRAGFVKFAAGMHTLNDQNTEPPSVSRSPKELSFQVSAGIDLDGAVKQELLAVRSTRGRLTRLDSLLDQLNLEITGRAAVHERARGNGRGGRNPDIVRAE